MIFFKKVLPTWRLLIKMLLAYLNALLLLLKMLSICFKMDSIKEPMLKKSIMITHHDHIPSSKS